MIWFDLVLWHINHRGLFNAKSFFYIYSKFMISKQILKITSFIMPEPIFFFFFTQLNGFIYFYQILAILFTINHLFAHTLMFSSISMYH